MIKPLFKSKANLNAETLQREWYSQMRHPDAGRANRVLKSEDGTRRVDLARISGYIVLVVGLLYTAYGGLHPIWSSISPQDQALVQLLGGLFFSVLLSTLLFAQGLHSRIDTVTEVALKASANSSNVISVLAGIESWVHLKPFRGVFHHYHLTKDANGQPVWIYKVLDFDGDQATGRLLASAAIMLTPNDNRHEHMYKFEASVNGSHLLIRSERAESPSDISIEIYPFVSGEQRTLYSAKVVTSWDRTLNASISILSYQPLAYLPASVVDGLPLDKEAGNRLRDDWERHSGIGRLPEDVSCDYMGDDRAAVEYIINKYKTSQSLIAIRDTHVRVDERQENYSSETYQRFIGALRELMVRLPRTHLFEMAGQKVDGGYVSLIAALAEQQENRVTVRQLRGESPLMNFIILEYEHAESDEVLFGWGHHSQGDPEAVFRSKNRLMVGEFKRFYQILLRDDVSIAIEPKSLLTARATTNSTVLDVLYDQWDEKRYNDFLKTVEILGPDFGDEDESDADLRLVTTVFLNWGNTKTQLEALLKRGASIKILIMNPRKRELVFARFGIRQDRYTPEKAVRNLQSQFEWLTSLSSTIKNCLGTLEVRTSDIMPFGFVALSRSGIVFGHMLAGVGFEKAPMHIASHTAPLWNRNDEDWKVRWQAAERQ